jgi:hypothetical protein
VETIAIARRLAGEHPHARLPCPVCAVSVNAENVDTHLAKVHPDPATVPPPWRGLGFLGIFPCSLAFDDDAVVLRHSLGLGRRTVTLPCVFEVGALFRSQPDAITASYADDTNQPSQLVRAGRYLRFVGDRAITIGCRQAIQLDGGRSCDLVLSRAAFVAVEYELARRGLLVPATR